MIFEVGPRWTWVRGACADCGVKMTWEINAPPTRTKRGRLRKRQPKPGGPPKCFQDKVERQMRDRFREMGCEHA